MERFADLIANIEGRQGELYSLLARIDLSEHELELFKRESLPTLFQRINDGFLRKDIAYLGLLANPRTAILSACVDFEANQPLDLHNGLTLFTHCFYNRRNWFTTTMKDELLQQHFDTNLQNLIHTFRIIQLTNHSPVTQFAEIRRHLSLVDANHLNDDFLHFYLDEIRYILSVIDFCMNCTPSRSIDKAQLFESINNAKLLNVFDEYLALSDRTQWEKLLEMLRMEERRFDTNCESDLACNDVFELHSFAILAFILMALMKCTPWSRDEADFITSASELLSQMQPKLQIQILEDVFMLCFLQRRHVRDLKVDGGQERVFLCDNDDLEVLLNFVAFYVDALKAHIPIRSAESARLQDLDRHVKDALWRLKILDNRTSFGITHMLADAETLIQMSLEVGNFDKARQVIQIYDLQDTELAKEIIYTEKLNDLRWALTQSFNLQELHKQFEKFGQPSIEKTPQKILTDFFANDCNFDDVFDIAFTLNTCPENTKQLLEFANNQSPSKFHSNVSMLFNALQSASIREILLNPTNKFTLDEYDEKTQFLRNIETNLAAFYSCLDNKQTHPHVINKTFTELNLLVASKSNSNHPNYFLRLLNYLSIFLRAFNMNKNNSDLIARGNFVSHFDILEQPRRKWMEKLLLERKTDPRDFEHLFSKLKVDLLWSTASCCFPDIRLDRNSSSFSTFEAPTQDVFSYITKRNWLLAFIINEIFHLTEIDVNSARTKYFTQYVDTAEMTNLKILYNENRVIAALHHNHYHRCVDYMNENIFESNDEGDMVEPAEEISEDDPKCNWKHLLNLIDSVPEYQAGEEIDSLRDKILANLVEDAFETDAFMFVKFVKDERKRRQLILDNFSHWPGEFCVSLLRSESDVDLLSWAERIAYCESIRNLFDIATWHSMHTLCLAQPFDVRTKLLQVPKAALLIDFERHFRGEQLPQISLAYLASLFRNNEDLHSIEMLLNNAENADDVCFDLVPVVRDLRQLDFLISYMRARKCADENLMRNVRVCSRILRLFADEERTHLWSLIKTPLAIIEMLIMNMKLDRLGSVLGAIRGDLENCEFSENVISLEAIDELLRKYAEKSLEVRVILDPHPSLLHRSDGKLMESLDSNYGPDRKCFQMPETIPSREDWVPNNEVLECMCCQNTIFSMFNRRHHCRRCGRIICFNCSTRRMHVATYGDILVRVCIDCYDQSQPDGRSDSVSTKSVIYDQWFLSDSNEHNSIVRQEFSYEHAPSVSLCLSIMKHHTKTYLYPKFLLDQCDAMLKLLQPPTHNAPQEVDYVLVIKMLRSLAIAAKMISSHCQLSWGSSQADRILSQADLFALLAERGCLNLLPPASTPHVDAIILRKLRDKLLMQEQWHFALDISTKAGLENAVVFAAWGKNCLKAGCLQLARDKFHRCFEKSSLSLEDDFIDAKHVLDKPAKNPPILEQIIEILECHTISLTNNSHSKASYKEKDSAILIKTKLRNLKAIANGRMVNDGDFNGCNLDPVYFQECLYYLKRYGSHLGLLQFYLQHNCIKQCLMYIFEHKVHADIFIEVYTICLRDGKIDVLQKALSRFDSTLEIWKDYLKVICRYLEKQGLFNSLYQLQQFMVDFVRASMTCIRFYKENATSYRELSTKIHFLHQAEAHLLQELEQQQWVEINAVADNVSDNEYEEKIALSNPSLVMKMDSKAIDQHIRTIRRQNRLTSFLAQHETSDTQCLQILSLITPNIEGEHNSGLSTQLPTLFDSHNEKMQLAILLIVCDEEIRDGYDLAQSLIEDYKLKALRVYCQAGRQLAREDRYTAIAELVSCIRSKGLTEPAVINICDEMLMLAVRTLSRNEAPMAQLEVLIKLITDRATKISIYIETKQLKSAYLLAAKYNRFGDIRRIQREAELLNKHDIKKLCQKLLHAHSHSKD